MNEVDSYLKRATRGLWGEKKRDAQTELRGAIEDKIHRHRLLGLNETEATTAALRDLGSPRTIARELGEVHTLPQLLKTTLFVSIGAMLSLQAVAQVATVRAIPLPGQTPICTFEAAYLSLFPGATSADVQRQLARPGGAQALEEAVLNKLPSSEASAIRQLLGQPGGRDNVTAECLRASPTPGSRLLRLSDVVAALQAGGIRFAPVLGTDDMFHLSVPGEAPNQLLVLAPQTVAGEAYVGAVSLVTALTRMTTGPLQISGLHNPVVTVGQAKLQLGLSDPPLLATDLYGGILLDRLEPTLPQLKTSPRAAIGVFPDSLKAPNKQDQLRVNSPDGTLYGLLGNADLVRPSCGCADDQRESLYGLSVRAVQGGILPAPLTYGPGSAPAKLVASLPELLQATEGGQRALLVYRLDATDLHHLTYSPVPAAQLRVNPSP
ncbi:permease prefix domain 1-containing protein [Deinococcus humi]|uniref:Uncharacterized protein n=1 Tax=Deinococcus humi TaxID=662880 RepID=A0A7W8NGF0_9DEIO|nr:permease prefix domain 1-containing protein [Deinococcus humi]MBB5363703.1 hypothetical protein [Deinococcus humi]GGO29690.1 hypothetical protein GCM10008949_23560 [Deinococcus humi]